MDWQTIMTQQIELEKSFQGLKMIFEQAEKDFRERSQVLAQSIQKSQQQDAINLSKIHQALQGIIAANNSVKQNHNSNQ
jgi:hypothetical protein